MNGFTDKPTSTLGEDAFGVQQYIDGLSDFIRECNTPMTIAIQGDWGSGKTSMMNMIREKLKADVDTSWFNTWQYSQFNMGDMLAISFLSRLVTDLESDHDKKNDKLQKLLKTFGRLARTAAVIAAEALAGSQTAEAVGKGVAPSSELDTTDMSQAINDLKKQFQDAVNEKLARTRKDRLVIFIDDLDRLHPGKAVELLEVLKLFLDCDSCVFLLAIDYAVVSQGVKQKYGELIGEEKGKSFFDKIIQVPFKMPVAQYDVKNYVMTSMRALGLTVSDDKGELDSYVKLIQYSVGFNPRAMKRLFNAFLLLNKIAAGDTVAGPKPRKMLFAILCLQLSFENIYNYIVQNAEECDDAFLQRLKTSEAYTEDGEDERLALALHLHTDADIRSAVEFMNVFFAVLDQDDDKRLGEDEVASFVEILRFSTITANTSTVANADISLETRYRNKNRAIVKEIVDAENLQAAHFKLYQARTNKNPEWKRHDAGGLAAVSTAFGLVNMEFKIATDLQTEESSLSVYLYAGEKTDRSRFAERMQAWCSKQSYGFESVPEGGYWLNNKMVRADARNDIISYFVALLPTVIREIKDA